MKKYIIISEFYFLKILIYLIILLKKLHSSLQVYINWLITNAYLQAPHAYTLKLHIYQSSLYNFKFNKCSFMKCIFKKKEVSILEIVKISKETFISPSFLCNVTYKIKGCKKHLHKEKNVFASNAIRKFSIQCSMIDVSSISW